jgi:hypothetical protein
MSHSGSGNSHFSLSKAFLSWKIEPDICSPYSHDETCAEIH